MKKLIGFLMFLVLGIFFLKPSKVFAQITPDGNADDWYNYITQFEDELATATIETFGHTGFSEIWFTILIQQSPDSEYDGYYIQYMIADDGDRNGEYRNYFEEDLADVLAMWIFHTDLSFDELFGQYYDGEKEYYGIIFWNFEEEYWQIEPYGLSELDYYRQRVDYLENKIQQLQNALESEFDRGFEAGESAGYDAGYGDGHLDGYLIGFNEGESLGYEVGYNIGYEDGYDEGYQEGILLNNEEAYQEGFKDGEKSKIAENNEKFYNGIEKWLVPAIITVIALGGFVTIAARKRREE